MSGIAFKILKVTWPYLIVAIITGAFVGWVQQVRINGVKTTLTVKEHELKTCQEANKTNQVTITSLEAERDNAMKGCEVRIRLKERTLANIRRIDSIETKGGKANENDSPDGGDPLLGLLNGMFTPEQSGSKD